MNYILSYDIGTTSVKVCLFDENLQLADSIIREYVLLTPKNGYVELPPEEYWNAILQGTGEVLRRTAVDPRDVAAIVSTTQGETLIPVGEDGTALRNAIVWLDQRAEEEANELLKTVSAEAFYAKTGLPELNGFTPIAKLMWIRRNEPEIYAKTKCFLLLEDYIIYRFTGLCATEKSLVCSTGWYTFENDGYSDEILGAAGIAKEKLPVLHESGEIVSRGVLPEVRAYFGFREDIAVVSGAMDQTAGAVGAGNVVPGCISETTGTALVIGATLRAFHPEARPAVTVYRHYRKGMYLMMPICMTAGMFLKWFKDNFCEKETEEAEKRGVSPYDILSGLVEEAPPGCRGLVALPYLTGTLQPKSDPDARGVFFGVGLDTRKPEFVRAVYESVAFMLRENLELIETLSGEEIREIRSLGGGAKSGVWCQIKADITGKEILVPSQTESTALGAAMLAACAVGVCGTMEEACALSGQSYKRFHPHREDVYDRNYKIYTALYDRVSGLFAKPEA